MNHQYCVPALAIAAMALTVVLLDRMPPTSRQQPTPIMPTPVPIAPHNRLKVRHVEGLDDGNGAGGQTYCIIQDSYTGAEFLIRHSSVGPQMVPLPHRKDEIEK
jgi:hypothetical protein